jgi:nucleotide-binding universal stress UspA family protein
MERSIVVALDGSAFAERALPFATAVAERSGARLVLVRAAPDDDLVEAHDYLRGLAAPSRGIGGHGERPAVDTVAHPGVPAAVLLDEAHRRGADLLVLATHGRSGLGRWRYGSVADAVLRHADVPLLLVPATGDRTWPGDRAPRLLVTLDGSDFARQALPAAQALAQLTGAEVVLLRVVEPPDSSPFTPAVEEQLLGAAPEVTAAEAYLEEVAAGLRAGGGEVTTCAVAGPAAPTIAAVARDRDVDLIVMATHGRGGLARAVLGSVASGTLHRTDRPLLLVRPAGLRRPHEDASVPASGQGPLPPPVAPPAT